MDENYKKIRAVYDDFTIRVYQAYNSKIANEAVRLGHFGNNFKMERMTWIKPSFLWMMYRSGWAAKEGQEHILAIDITREGFNYIVKNAIPSTFKEEYGITQDEWSKKVKTSSIRCQWDPERNIHGNPLDYRSIQLGLRGEAVYKYVNEWTKKITDITPNVIEMRKLIAKGESIDHLLPKEKEYIVD